jgi:CRISPR-associated protein Cmr6
LLEKVKPAARNWMQSQNVTPQANPQTDWRETWYPQNVQVWGRLAEGRDNSLAIQWLHCEYSYKGGREVPLPIKGTSVTGMLNQISRLWHRMYPIVLKKPDPENEGKFLPKPTPSYLELLSFQTKP